MVEERLRFLGHFGFEVLHDGFKERFGRQPALFGADQQREVLGHLAALDGVRAHLLQRAREAVERRVRVELGAMSKTARPREDRRDRVGGGGLALLVLAVVARNRAVRGLGLDRAAVRGEQHRRHQA